VKGEASKFLVERIKEETLLHGDSLVSEELVLIMHRFLVRASCQVTSVLRLVSDAMWDQSLS